MLRRNYESQNCSAARALELVGDRWSLLILRDARFRGFTRFSQFEESLGVAPNILSSRLNRFVEQGLMVSPELDKRRRDYLLTEMGLQLTPVLMALTEWGDVWLSPGPVDFRDPDGRPARLVIVNSKGEGIDPGSVEARRRSETPVGPDLGAAAPTRPKRY